MLHQIDHHFTAIVRRCRNHPGQSRILRKSHHRHHAGPGFKRNGGFVCARIHNLEIGQQRQIRELCAHHMQRPDTFTQNQRRANLRNVDIATYLL